MKFLLITCLAAAALGTVLAAPVQANSPDDAHAARHHEVPLSSAGHSPDAPFDNVAVRAADARMLYRRLVPNWEVTHPMAAKAHRLTADTWRETQAAWKANPARHPEKTVAEAIALCSEKIESHNDLADGHESDSEQQWHWHPSLSVEKAVQGKLKAENFARKAHGLPPIDHHR